MNNIWLRKVKDRDFDGAEVCYSIMHELAPSVTPGNYVYSNTIEFAMNGNSRLGAEIVSLSKNLNSATQTDQVIEMLEKIDYNSECAYIQRFAHDCAMEIFRLIERCQIQGHIQYMYTLRDFTKNKKEYADVYKKAVEYIKNYNEIFKRLRYLHLD